MFKKGEKHFTVPETEEQYKSRFYAAVASFHNEIQLKEQVEAIRRGPDSIGAQNMLKHMTGQKLTFKSAIEAKCADCVCYFVDGRKDCENPLCPLYPWMRYGLMRKRHYIRPERRDQQ